MSSNDVKPLSDAERTVFVARLHRRQRDLDAINERSGESPIGQYDGEDAFSIAIDAIRIALRLESTIQEERRKLAIVEDALQAVISVRKECECCDNDELVECHQIAREALEDLTPSTRTDHTDA